MNLPSGFTHLTIAGGVRAAARRIPSKIALICDDKTLTYAELIERINRIANVGQTDLGLKTGDHVALLSPNCLEFMEIMCGVSDIGVAVATPNPRSSQVEVTNICNDAAVRVLFVHPSCEEKVDEKTFETVERVVRLDADYEELLAASKNTFFPPPISEWAPFSIPYTSGTTGRPKGVLISHRSRTLSFHAFAAEYGVYGPDDRFLAISPLCHGAGFAFAMASIYFGGTCEIAPAFDAQQTLRNLHAGKTTGIFMVPTHFHQIFDLDPAILQRNRGHAVRSMLCNAAALPQSTKEKVVDYFGDGVLHELYGSTEAGVVSSLRPADQLRKVQCVGLPFPNTQIRLLDDDGNETVNGDIGELYSLSPYLFNGYWNRGEETRTAFRDEWVGVGDLARFDDEGYLYIVGRKKDMVISGGVNIYPREIEEVIGAHVAVREVAVIGVPDDEWGERLVAYVALGSNERLSAEEIQLDCRDKLASYKSPKEVVFVDDLPRNVAGKVLKVDLRNGYLPPSS